MVINMFGKKKAKEEEIVNIDATDGDPSIDETKKDESQEEEPKKEKKKFHFFQKFNVYKFIIKIVATILLITLGILILVNKDNAKFAMFIIAGGVTLFQAIIRSFFLLKKSRNKKAKIVTAVEIGLEILLGVFFIFAAIAQNSVTAAKAAEEAGEAKKEVSSFNQGLSDFANKYYSIFISIIFYVASISYFWRTILYDDETDKFKFWLNFALVTGGFALLFANIIHVSNSDDHEPISAWAIAVIIAILAFLSALVIGGEATGGYIQYRKTTKPIKKKDEEDTKNEIEAPAKDDKKEYNDIDPNTIPADEPNTDSDIIS